MQTYSLCFFSQALDNKSDDPMYQVVEREINPLLDYEERQRVSEVSFNISVKGKKIGVDKNVDIKRLGSDVLIEFSSDEAIKDINGRTSFNYILIESINFPRDANSLIEDIKEFSEKFLKETGRGNKIKKCDTQEIIDSIIKSKKYFFLLHTDDRRIYFFIIAIFLIILLAIKAE